MHKITPLRLPFSWIASIATCMLLAVAAHAQPPANQNQAVTEIIRLQHRAPASIRAAIEPQLDPRGVINQIDNSLIISTSRANLTQLRQRIGELDTPLRRLRLSVDFAYGQQQPSPTPPDASSIATETQPSTRQSIVVTEGESVWFQNNRSAPQMVPSFNEYELGLATDDEVIGFGINVELRNNQIILRTAMPQDGAADVSADLQNRLLTNTIALEPGVWFVLNSPPESTAPESAPVEEDVQAVAQDLLAVQVVLL